mmetsp:Transcript_24046/g.32762  ORF Transcript_24046/g.32762 Transcript_24046/m.32762 type:complete len:136 (-) Transcript_24046:183-590(-)
MVTLGLDFVPYKYKMENGQDVLVKLWDTAGQERFRTLTHSFYQSAHGVILVYDVTKEDSFHNIETWLTSIREHASSDVKKILVANKIDLEEERVITQEQGVELAAKESMKFFEVSCKTNINIDEAMAEVMSQVCT